MRPDRDQRLRDALDVAVPPLSLAAIHQRADVAARLRLQRFMYGTVASVVLALTISGARADSERFAQAIPFVDPGIPTPLASVTPYYRTKDATPGNAPNPVPAPTPAPSPMIT